MASLAAFAGLLALSPVAQAGWAIAASGVYVAASLAWLWAVKRQRPARWDALGAAVCLLGAATILWAPRGG